MESDGKLNDEVADADGGAARAAVSAKKDVAQEGDVLPPGQAALAGAAMGARAYDAFAGGPAGEAHVEETAEGQAEEAGNYGAENAHQAEDTGKREMGLGRRERTMRDGAD